MGCYYFDFSDGHDQIRDDMGLEAHSREEALQEAIAALTRMASEYRQPSNGYTLSMTVRDDADSPIYRITNTTTWTVLSEGGRSR
jgi:hypothetical protein